jgi:hypothetical protein
MRAQYKCIKLWQMPESTFAQKVMWHAWWMFKYHQCDNWCARLTDFLLGVQPRVQVGERVVPLHDDKQCGIVLMMKVPCCVLQPGLTLKMASYHTQFATNISDSTTPPMEWNQASYFDFACTVETVVSDGTSHIFMSSSCKCDW